MLRRDTLDFRAWFGRGECRSQDHTVIRDRSSPSGWAFRSGYQSAINDYHKALTLVPSVHRAFRGAAFQRLSRLFYAERNIMRWGRPLPPDTGRFVAFPSLRSDTLAFVPYPIAELNNSRGDLVPDGPASARDRNVSDLAKVTAMWVKAYPESPDAWEARASLLEASGDLEGGPDTSSALPALRRARALAATRADSLRLRTSEAQVLIKLGRYEEAVRAIDSTLAALSNPTPEEADQVSGLAAVTGRAARLAALLRLAATLPRPPITDEIPEGTHPSLRGSLAALFAYSVVGGPADSAARMLRVVDDQIRAYIPLDTRAQFRAEALQFPMMMLHPVEVANLEIPASPPRSYLRRYQYYLQKGDTATLRSALDSLKRIRTYTRPAEVSLDGVYHEAVLTLALRDTSGAVRQLDQVLNALPAAGLDLIRWTGSSGSLVRAMMLRAQLAARLGDVTTARRWAGAAAILWAKADPGLQAGVDSMRRIASGSF
jgi:tetratricopeptide (TPR) repeat protein